MKRKTSAIVFIAVVGSMASCSKDEEPIPTSASSGFSLQESAFSFENFASGYEDSRMTPALVARMYGPESVCANKALPCDLTPSATAWMNRVNGAMNGGRCEGFAVLSSLFFTGVLDANAFGAPTAYQLKLQGNLALQEELAYWFATQNVEATAQATQKFNAKDALRFLAKFLPGAREGGEFFRIGMVRKTKKTVTGGHAVTPIGYEQSPTEGVYYVHVYDNNFPAQDRYITIDTNKNRWEYRGAANPAEPAAVYTGDEKNNNYLYFAPVRNRLGTLACKFCKSGKGDKKYVVVDGADVTARTKGGATAGVKGGNIDESGGAVVPSFSAQTWDNNAPITLVLDPEETTFELSASESNSNARASIAEFGPGWSAEARNFQVGAGAPDTFQVGEGGSNVAYKSTVGSGVNLASAVETANGNVVQVEVKVPAGATQATASVDKNTGAVQAKTEGAGGQEVTLVVTKVDGATGKTQTGTVTAPAGETNTLTADTSTWAPGAPLEVKQDSGDGNTVVLRDGCFDGAQSGTETDVDCGGVCSTKCATGQTCAANADCASGACNRTSGKCVASLCEDGVKNGNEADVDCGGSCDAKCANGRACTVGTDCTSNVCGGAQKCAESLCSDGVKSGTEGDVDCGGSCATKCAQGKACSVSSDCEIASCVSNVCDTTDRTVFVTVAAFTGNFGGLSGADARCQAAADAAGLYGTYKAFLSDGTASAASRMTSTSGRYVLVNGTAVANNGAEFFSSTHLAPINIGENGSLQNGAEVFTGSNGPGNPVGGNCNNWTDGSSRQVGFQGLTHQSNDQWSSAYDQFCDRGGRLYCVRQ